MLQQCNQSTDAAHCADSSFCGTLYAVKGAAAFRFRYSIPTIKAGVQYYNSNILLVVQYENIVVIVIHY